MSKSYRMVHVAVLIRLQMGNNLLNRVVKTRKPLRNGSHSKRQVRQSSSMFIFWFASKATRPQSVRLQVDVSIECYIQLSAKWTPIIEHIVQPGSGEYFYFCINVQIHVFQKVEHRLIVLPINYQPKRRCRETFVVNALKNM